MVTVVRHKVQGPCRQIFGYIGFRAQGLALTCTPNNGSSGWENGQ